MAYLDLNPIIANTLQTGQYSSIFERIYDKASIIDNKTQLPFIPKPLLDFIGNKHQNLPKGIAFSLLDYSTLVEAK
tara:strand:- start:651 stop:878 length:228 start_codon:yes stop_codon:yes gene_type:complete